MLFNSYIFLFGFLPIILILYYWSGRAGKHRPGIVILALASLVFYGWWNPVYVILLMCSIVFNYTVGYLIGYPGSIINSLSGQYPARKTLLITGVCTNLILLAYFKYANFFVDSINMVSGSSFFLEHIILPLGISFFTFTQIAFLVDTFRDQAREPDFYNYLLFVTFFPHLIAGPILHHKEMMPQFAVKGINRFNAGNFALGLTIFGAGLFKKSILADSIALYADPVFNAVAAGANPTLIESWIGAVGYSLQLYFDFSGYSDMAIGLALMCNIKMPINFNSPYKAASIIDFWRRWHMTLSRFLKDYLYIPLGGNQLGRPRRYLNLLVTMILGGLWHGAGWTFALWGLLHGLYLVVNNMWRWLAARWGITGPDNGVKVAFKRVLTLFCVVTGWVFFRSSTVGDGWQLFRGMIGLNGISLHYSMESSLAFLGAWGVRFNGFTPAVSDIHVSIPMMLWFTGLIGIALFAPTILDLTAKQSPALGMESLSLGREAFAWNTGIKWACIAGLLLALGIVGIGQTSEFLYFQF